MGKQPFRVAFVGIRHDRHRRRIAALSPSIHPQAFTSWTDLEQRVPVFQPELVVMLPEAGPPPVSVFSTTLTTWAEGDLELEPAMLEQRLLRRPVPPDDQELERLLGRSPVMARLRGLLKTMAASDYSLFLTGENGTGKDLAAMVAHRLSRRAAGTLVPVNCGAIPPGLAETEFFGSVKGAFTGAETRPGLCQQASGGTLFLDEVGELPLEIQAKLLRVFENKEVRRVGSNRVERVDFRLICATNRDLEADVRRGRFREDLFYRINVLPIHLPALRERKEDLRQLAEHFLAAEQSAGMRRLTIGADAVAKMAEYHWPGNLRQLRNAIQRAAVLCQGRQIGARDIRWD